MPQEALLYSAITLVKIFLPTSDSSSLDLKIIPHSNEGLLVTAGVTASLAVLSKMALRKNLKNNFILP